MLLLVPLPGSFGLPEADFTRVIVTLAPAALVLCLEFNGCVHPSAVDIDLLPMTATRIALPPVLSTNNAAPFLGASLALVPVPMRLAT